MGPGIFLVLELHDRAALDKMRAPALFIEIRKKTISRSWKGHKDVKQSNSNAAHLRPRRWRKLLTLLAARSLIAGIFGMTPLLSASPPCAFAAGSQTCDIYGSGGTPCVAAHSTTRAL